MSNKVSGEITNLLGKKILRIVSAAQESKAYVILFDDGKTYMRLEEQDYYSYHDCSTSARHLEVGEGKETWDHFNTLLDAKELS